MKIFISWSGERSEALAKALREWFPLVLHFVEPWLSQSDIQAGERWSIEIAKELEDCNFGVICITKENLSSPWILFEAGALAKSMQEGRVIPLLLDLDFKEISGPLSQFQAKKADASGLKDLVSSLNKAAASNIPDIQLDKLFSALWPDIEKQIADIPKNTAPTKHTRPQGEILEELVSSIRSVEVRVRDVIDDNLASRRKRRIRLHPGAIHEFMHRISDSPRDPIQILFVASLVRDDVPWLYEIAMEAYRAIRGGHGPSSEIALRRFLDSLELILRGQFFEDLGVDRMMLKVVSSDLYELFETFSRPDEVKTNPAKIKVVRRNRGESV